MKFEGLIGSTPLYQSKQNLFLKLEYTGLTGSVKDRAALEMILEAERSGLLRQNCTIIEPTSGNMGISLAAIAAQRGYGCVIVMPDTMSQERQMMIKAFGAEVILTPGALGMVGAVEKAKALAKEISDGWIADQFTNPANAAAHYHSTGPEIWAQTNGAVDILVAGVGTGGTITGTGRFLKEKKPSIRVVAVEPAQSPLLSSGRWGNHEIQGIGANFVPPILDIALLDRIFTVADDQAFRATKKLVRQGIPVGISSGAAYHVAEFLAGEHPQKNIVAIMPDGADRYLSTGIL